MCSFSFKVWARRTSKGKSFSLPHLSERGHFSGGTSGCNEVNDARRVGGREGRKGRKDRRRDVGILAWREGERE